MKGRWEGKHCVELKKATVDEAWTAVEDFCNLHKWFPGLDTCYAVEGVPGEPGLVRYCTSTKILSDSGKPVEKISWAKEKLVNIDRIKKSLSYEISDNNIGFKSYVATIGVLPISGGDEGGGGCVLWFSYVADPVEGWGHEDLKGYIEYCVAYMGNKIEDAFCKSDN